MTPSQVAAPSLSPQALGSLLYEQESRLGALFRRMNLGGMEGDLLQDTAEKALKCLGQFRGDCAPATWLYHVARSVALDHLRKKARSGEAVLPVHSGRQLGGEGGGDFEDATFELADHSANPLDLLIAMRSLRLVQEVLDELPADLQELALEEFGVQADILSALQEGGLSPERGTDGEGGSPGSTRSKGIGAKHSRVSRLRKKLANQATGA